jgi:hypothetical protein
MANNSCMRVDDSRLRQQVSLHAASRAPLSPERLSTPTVICSWTLMTSPPPCRAGAPGGLTRDPNATKGVYSPTGSYGDPTLATAAKGKILVEGMVTHLIERVMTLSTEAVQQAPETMPSAQ